MGSRSEIHHQADWVDCLVWMPRLRDGTIEWAHARGNDTQMPEQHAVSINQCHSLTHSPTHLPTRPLTHSLACSYKWLRVDVQVESCERHRSGQPQGHLSASHPNMNLIIRKHKPEIEAEMSTKQHKNTTDADRCPRVFHLRDDAPHRAPAHAVVRTPGCAKANE